ncbi:chaperonin 10-like protein [Xylariaceae sp. FL0804]|nr:chaperonin 10-like protein [Xylariaceae sp. FL0804]
MMDCDTLHSVLGNQFSGSYADVQGKTIRPSRSLVEDGRMGDIRTLLMYLPARRLSAQYAGGRSSSHLTISFRCLDHLTRMKAVVSGALGQYVINHEVEVPEPRPGQLLVKVYAIALNPADAKMLDYSATAGRVGGHDFAGRIVKLGPGLEGGRSRYQEGDRVLGTTVGLNPSDPTAGAFAEYALAFADLACRLPEDMSYEDACSMGVSVGTAGMALFQALRLPMPDNTEHVTKDVDGQGAENDDDYQTGDAEDSPPSTTVLVSGGATSTGTMAIQLLKCAGLTPIAMCSPA